MIFWWHKIAEHDKPGLRQRWPIRDALLAVSGHFLAHGVMIEVTQRVATGAGETVGPADCSITLDWWDIGRFHRGCLPRCSMEYAGYRTGVIPLLLHRAN